MRIQAARFELKNARGDAVKRCNIEDVPFGWFHAHRFTGVKEIPISGHLATGPSSLSLRLSSLTCASIVAIDG